MIVASTAAGSAKAGPVEYIVWGLVAVVLLGLAPRLWRLWVRGERLRSGYGASASARADNERMLTWSASVFLFALIGWSILASGTRDVALAVVGLIAFALAGVSAILAFSIRLLRWPNWAIPAVLRDAGPSRELARFDREARRVLHAVVRAQRAERGDARRTVAESRSRSNAARWRRVEDDARRSAQRWAHVRELLAGLTPPAALLAAHEQMIVAVTHHEEDQRRRADAVRAGTGPADLQRDEEPHEMRDAYRAYLRGLREAGSNTSSSPTPPATRRPV